MGVAGISYASAKSHGNDKTLTGLDWYLPTSRLWILEPLSVAYTPSHITSPSSLTLIDFKSRMDYQVGTLPPIPYTAFLVT